MSNSAQDILSRLLNLYPAAVLKSEWEVDATNKVDVIAEIVATRTAEEIGQFARKCFGFTKQHVALFVLTPSQQQPGNLPSDVFPNLTKTIATSASAGARTSFHLVDLSFQIADRHALTRKTLKFKWPIEVYQKGDVVRVASTIMEKDLASYTPSRGPVVLLFRSVTEKALIAEVRGVLPATRTLLPLDIHKGIKAMWESGLVDATKAQWKRSRSTRTESMDEDFGLKRTSPEAYAEAILAPLLRMQFMFLNDAETFVDHFVAYPGEGRLSFPLFGGHPEGVNNVVGKILELNR